MWLTRPTDSLSPDICWYGMIHRDVWLPAWAPKVVNTLDQIMAMIALGNFSSPTNKTFILKGLGELDLLCVI